MNLGSEKKYTHKFILTLFMMSVFALNAFCAENSVSSIKVKQIEDGEYEILLKTDKSARVRKTVEGDSLILTIDSVVPSNSVEIVYDNAPGIQNITVQKKNSDSTLVFMQGNNIKNSVIYTKNLSTGQVNLVNSDNGLFFIADKNILRASTLIMICLFMFLIAMRPQKKKYYENKNEINGLIMQKKSASTLRHKALIQSANIPSINSKINGSFVSTAITKPLGYIADENYMTEKMRKVG